MAKSDNVIVGGQVQTIKIKETHRAIKKLCESYKDINRRVEVITKEVRDSWVGKGRNEFENQYNLLIGKIEDFGDTLDTLYEALVDAEAAYQTTDNKVGREYIKIKEQSGS